MSAHRGDLNGMKARSAADQALEGKPIGDIGVTFSGPGKDLAETARLNEFSGNPSGLQPTSLDVAARMTNDVNGVVQMAQVKPGECLVVTALHREDSDPKGAYAGEFGLLNDKKQLVSAGHLPPDQERVIESALKKKYPQVRGQMDAGFRSIASARVIPKPCM